MWWSVSWWKKIRDVSDCLTDPRLRFHRSKNYRRDVRNESEYEINSRLTVLLLLVFLRSMCAQTVKDWLIDGINSWLTEDDYDSNIIPTHDWCQQRITKNMKENKDRNTRTRNRLLMSKYFHFPFVPLLIISKFFWY